MDQSRPSRDPKRTQRRLALGLQRQDAAVLRLNFHSPPVGGLLSFKEARVSATPCPGNPGCRCPYCWGLAEYTLNATGHDYGLPATYVPIQRVQQAPEPAVLQFRPRRVRQPWEPRPARRAA